MTEDEIRNIVFQELRKIAPETNLDQLGPNENLRETLDIDSFDFLNFLIALHEKLHVEIPESDYGKLGSLGEMVRYLSARRK